MNGVQTCALPISERAPSPSIAAISSFVCFSIGAIVPLIPYLVGGTSLWVALVVGGVGLFAAGALTARFTHRPWWRSGLRQLRLEIGRASCRERV